MLCEHVVEKVGQCVGRGGRGFRRPEFPPHAAKKGPERTGAGAETLRRHAQGATGAIVDPSAARGEHFTTPDRIVRTEAHPRGTRFVGRACMPMEAYFCEDDRDRGGLSPRHWGEVAAGDAVERGPEVKGRFVALRLPMRRRWGRQGRGGRIEEGRNVLRTRRVPDRSR